MENVIFKMAAGRHIGFRAPKNSAHTFARVTLAKFCYLAPVDDKSTKKPTLSHHGHGIVPDDPTNIRASAGRYVFRWDRLLGEGLAFVRAGVPYDVTCANFKCDVADVNKQNSTDFRGVKSVSGECYQPFRENSS